MRSVLLFSFPSKKSTHETQKYFGCLRLIYCWLQWQKFHAYAGGEQVQQLSISKKGWDGTQQGNGF